MKRIYLFLLAVALITSTPLFTSCSDSDGKHAVAEKTLYFYVMLTQSQTDFELFDEKEVINQLQTLASQTLTQTLGGKNTVVIPETEVNALLDSVKLAFDKLVEETNAKRAYPGLYTFTVKCNEQPVTEATFYTPDIMAVTKMAHSLSYSLFNGDGPFDLKPGMNPSGYYLLSTELRFTRPKDASIPYGGDETLVHEFSNVYGDVISSYAHDITKILANANKYKSANKKYASPCSLHGGEYAASVHCDFLEYTETTNFTVSEDPGISFNNEKNFDDPTYVTFQVTLTTGYPFNVDDYMDNIVLNATVVKEVDGQDEPVAEVPLTVKLVDDPSRTRVAGYKTIDIVKIPSANTGKYKVRLTSDWKPGNGEQEITVAQIPED